MALGLYLSYPKFTNDGRPSASVTCGLSGSLSDSFFDALKTETNLIAKADGLSDRRLSAIYIGGGSVNIDQVAQLGLWLDQIGELFGWDDPLEVTATIAPKSCNRQLLERLFALGVTRLDFEIGSFDRRMLRLLGRKHTVHQVHRAIYLSGALGFGSFGCDFVFGLPGQTAKILSADMDQLTDLEPPHITLKRWDVDSERASALTVDPPIPEFVDTLRKAAVENLSELGYEEYVADLFARPDHKCRYLADRADGADYIGLGLSAESLIGGNRSRNISDPMKYIDALNCGRLPLIDS
jgi:oxygen-independent coproporphyrinogen-3 oxidase